MSIGSIIFRAKKAMGLKTHWLEQITYLKPEELSSLSKDIQRDFDNQIFNTFTRAINKFD